LTKRAYVRRLSPVDPESRLFKTTTRQPVTEAQSDEYRPQCTVNNDFCISKPTPMPARIWKPISFASDVVVLGKNSSPDPGQEKLAMPSKTASYAKH
jgi:hypothetical protein